VDHQQNVVSLQVPSDQGQGGPVVTVQSTKIGAKRRGFDPSSVCLFLVRKGEEAGRLSTAEL
jgi:hypothetical protein